MRQLSPLRAWREGNGMAIPDLVVELRRVASFGVTVATVSHWERGHSFPGIDAIVALKRVGAEAALKEMISWVESHHKRREKWRQ